MSSAADGTHQERVWRPDWPCSVLGALAAQRRGAGDPTFQVEGQGRVWRGIRTPWGPATLCVEPRTAIGEVVATAWGPGAAGVLDQLPALLGADDDWSGFEPRHPLIADLRRRHPNLRIGRTGLIMEALTPAIIEQKVTGQEAFAGFATLVRRFGELAPGPGGERGLMVQPDAERLAGIASWEWLGMHIDPARSRTLVHAARHAASLERLINLSAEEAGRRLMTLPGIGVWTAAEVRQRAFGDPDAVSFGDYHVAKDVGWALTGQPFDDAQLEAFLEPWRPHRGRVPLLVAVGGLHRPRHGARMAPRTHLPANLPSRRGRPT